MAGVVQSTDILDEDAADLQFPKDDLIIDEDCPPAVVQDVCNICRNPYNGGPQIICAVCQDMELCLQCFALGLESQTHRNFHSYRVSCLKIPLDDDPSWTPQDDYELLEGLRECGYGNYVDLGRKLKRSYEEIRERIDKLCHLDTAPLQGCLEVAPKPFMKYWPGVILEEPPRYPTNSHPSKSSAGYNAPRGDFDVEFDNKAEEIVSMIEDPESSDEDSDEELTSELNCAMVSCYNERLRERFRRKSVIRTHGLLLRKFSMVMSRYNQKMFVFMQLLNGGDFDSLLEGLNMEESLLKEHSRLKRYRRLGITRLNTIALYDTLDTMRSESKKQISSVKFAQHQITAEKRKAPPIEIEHFPLFSKLNTEEKELCANIRLLPETYLSFKEILINEFFNKGFVRLKTARQMLKIDVNKTRRIFNYLRDASIILEEPNNGGPK